VFAILAIFFFSSGSVFAQRGASVSTDAVPNQLTFFTNPPAGGTIQVQSPTASFSPGGPSPAYTAVEDNNIVSAQFSLSYPLFVTQLGVYVNSFNPGAAVTLGLYNDNGGAPGSALPTTLIAQTNQVQITASNTWLYGSLPAPAIL
jgi:hypothetical protein